MALSDTRMPRQQALRPPSPEQDRKGETQPDRAPSMHAGNPAAQPDVGTDSHHRST